MVLQLCEALDIPLRERNALMLAAGFAPVFPKRDLADADLAPARAAVELVLQGHMPFPALAVDRLWNMVSANGAVAPLLADVAPRLLQAPINVLRLSLAADGLGGRIINYGEWRAHILARLRAQVDASGDPDLQNLLEELRALPSLGDARRADRAAPDLSQFVVPLRLRTALGELSFISTTTLFGTPVDVTLSELAIESLFPADAFTGEALQRLASQLQRGLPQDAEEQV